MKPNAHIKEAGDAIKRVFQTELPKLADAMIAQLMVRARRKQDLSVIKKELKWPGEQAYRAKILEALSIVAMDAVKAARAGAPARVKKIKLEEILDSIKLDDETTTIFSKLPKALQQKVQAQAGLLVDSQLKDIETGLYYQYTTSHDTTDSMNLLQTDLEDNADDYISGNAINSGANLVAAKVVNDARSAFYFDDDVLDQVDAFIFTNGDPVTQICQDLDGRVFSKDDPDMFRYTPPLHWNCKSYIEPIYSGDLNGREIVPLGGDLSQKVKDSIQFNEFCSCNH